MPRTVRPAATARASTSSRRSERRSSGDDVARDQTALDQFVAKEGVTAWQQKFRSYDGLRFAVALGHVHGHAHGHTGVLIHRHRLGNQRTDKDHQHGEQADPATAFDPQQVMTRH